MILYCVANDFIFGVRGSVSPVQDFVQTYLTHINIMFEYCHASETLYKVDILYLEDGTVTVGRPVLKNNTATMFFLKKTVLVNDWRLPSL